MRIFGTECDGALRAVRHCAATACESRAPCPTGAAKDWVQRHIVPSDPLLRLRLYYRDRHDEDVLVGSLWIKRVRVSAALSCGCCHGVLIPQLPGQSIFRRRSSVGQELLRAGAAKTRTEEPGRGASDTCVREAARRAAA